MITVKFKDLPEKVQTFINRVHGFEFPQNDDIILDSIHTASEWSKATDEERLAYAEWKYPKGTKFTCVYNANHNGFVEFYKTTIENWIYSCGGKAPQIAMYIYARDKWAEIIEEPQGEERERIENKIKEMAKESTLSGAVLINTCNGEPEFKAGDEVEVRFNDWPESIWRLRTYAGLLLGKHWCRYKDEMTLTCFHEIRKPDPDSKLREIAKQLIEKYVNQINKHNHNEHIFVDNDCEQMLIEAIKKGKSL